uniref:Wsv313-like protein n=1 Tax=Trachysalambria curvirostris majanivirus TaxID=2984281 RepID=A0A9C7BIJ6_9VIRU|nr:MAG: wsv313-like protein [Trachysalambria curvirostris majanivirus]
MSISITRYPDLPISDDSDDVSDNDDYDGYNGNLDNGNNSENGDDEDDYIDDDNDEVEDIKYNNYSKRDYKINDNIENIQYDTNKHYDVGMDNLKYNNSKCKRNDTFVDDKIGDIPYNNNKRVYRSMSDSDESKESNIEDNETDNNEDSSFPIRNNNFSIDSSNIKYNNIDKVNYAYNLKNKKTSKDNLDTGYRDAYMLFKAKRSNIKRKGNGYNNKVETNLKEKAIIDSKDETDILSNKSLLSEVKKKRFTISDNIDIASKSNEDMTLNSISKTKKTYQDNTFDNIDIKNINTINNEDKINQNINNKKQNIFSDMNNEDYSFLARNSETTKKQNTKLDNKSKKVASIISNENVNLLGDLERNQYGKNNIDDDDNNNKESMNDPAIVNGNLNEMIIEHNIEKNTDDSFNDDEDVTNSQSSNIYKFFINSYKLHSNNVDNNADVVVNDIKNDNIEKYKKDLNDNNTINNNHDIFNNSQKGYTKIVKSANKELVTHVNVSNDKIDFKNINNYSDVDINTDLYEDNRKDFNIKNKPSTNYDIINNDSRVSNISNMSDNIKIPILNTDQKNNGRSNNYTNNDLSYENNNNKCDNNIFDKTDDDNKNENENINRDAKEIYNSSYRLDNSFYGSNINIPNIEFNILSNVSPNKEEGTNDYSHEPVLNKLINDVNNDIRSNIEEDINDTNLIIENNSIRLLEKHTHLLECRKVIDNLFKSRKDAIRRGVNFKELPPLPSPSQIDVLKKTIMSELMIKKLEECKKISNISELKLYAANISMLTDLQEKQILRNPMLDIYAKKYHDGEIHQRDNEKDCILYISEEIETLARTRFNYNYQKIECLTNLLNRLLILKTTTLQHLLFLINLLRYITIGVIKKTSKGPYKKNIIGHKYNPRKYNKYSIIKQKQMVFAGIELFYSFATKKIVKHITHISQRIGNLALRLGIPLILIKWTECFKKTYTYKSLLRKSIYSISNIITDPALVALGNFTVEQKDKCKDIDANNNNIYLYNNKYAGYNDSEKIENHDIISMRSILNDNTSIVDDISRDIIEFLHENRDNITIIIINMINKLKILYNDNNRMSLYLSHLPNLFNMHAYDRKNKRKRKIRDINRHMSKKKL